MACVHSIELRPLLYHSIYCGNAVISRQPLFECYPGRMPSRSFFMTSQ